jgi:SAM-dependent methyltransferase
VHGQRILEYGCGTGELSCELALCGAEVTGFDLSPQSIAGANRRAALHGLADRVQFEVRQAGATGYPRGSYDIVVGQAILHHLHTELPAIYEEIHGLLRPQGVACFIEPVANSALMRTLRRWVPIKSDTTPDERQLRYEDFAGLRRHFSRLEFHHFYGLDRLRRILGTWASPSLRWLDGQLQKIAPMLRSWYGVVLVIARQ